MIKKSLLLLDDSHDTLFVLSEFLKDSYEFLEKTVTVAQANEALSQRAYTHVLVDYKINKKSIEHNLLTQWRSIYPNIEYLAIFTGIHFERNQWPDGCDELFQKPNDLHRLLRTMIDLGNQPRGEFACRHHL